MRECFMWNRSLQNKYQHSSCSNFTRISFQYIYLTVHILRIYTWLILGTCFDWFWRRCGCGSSCHAAFRWSARVACSPLHKLEIYIYSKSYKGSEGEKLKNKNHRVSSNVKYILASLRIFSSVQRLSFNPNLQKTNTVLRIRNYFIFTLSCIRCCK